MGQNPAVGAPNAALERRALAKLRVARRARHGRGRDGDVLEGFAGSDVGRTVAGSNRHRGVFLSGGGPRRKGRDASPTRSACCSGMSKAVEPPGDCRSDALVRLFELGRRLKAKAAADTRSVQRRPARADVGLSDHRSARRAGLRSGAARDQRLSRGRRRRTAARDSLITSRASRSSRPTDRRRAAAGSTPASSRRRVKIARARRAGARVRTATAGDTRGRPIAASSTTARRRGRTARRGANARRSCGGTSASANGPDTTRRIFRARKPPSFTRGRVASNGEAAIAGDAAVHHARRRTRLVVGADRSQRWTAARALRADRIAGRRTRLYPQPDESRRPIARARADNPWATSPDPNFPHVLTTYRLTEHHTAGGMSRTLSHLAELQPALFCELSPELAHASRRPARRARSASSPRAAASRRARS